MNNKQTEGEERKKKKNLTANLEIFFSACLIFQKKIKCANYALGVTLHRASSSPPRTAAATPSFPGCRRTHTEPEESWHPDGFFFFRHAKTS